MSRRTSQASRPPSVGTHNYNLQPRPHRVVSARLAESVPSTPGSRYPLRSRISMGCTMSAIDPLESSSRSNNVFTPVNASSVSGVSTGLSDIPITSRVPKTIQDLTDYLSSNRAVVDLPWAPRAPPPAANLNPPPGRQKH
ncbi:hypothetical protein Pst134EA_013119 [Puccinia striiformis f. sp. tritici]|uniref:hypothetical protein n=1 Tax=Puccinia striiformis f. sp. tritici TaxID=168172 RepID=UPI0020089871|nr:hypothetical protein Pst134EA_013119 [Puccinia striiformis f. sp. tritici]KAH9465228.1 hypothetical protein Pst134EA_013119 [Puccinia striiformis f. sp. tritici]